MLRLIALIGTLFLVPQWTVPLHIPAAGGNPCVSLPFSDNFTRPDGALGSPWLQSSGGTIQIASHEVTNGAFATFAVAWPSGCPFSGTTQYAQAVAGTITGTGEWGVTVFTQDSSNYWFVDCSPTAGCTLLTLVAGSYTSVGTFSNIPTTGQTFCLEVSGGSTVKLKINGSYDPTVFTGVGGLSSGAGGVYFDNALSTPATLGNFQTGNGLCP